MDRRRLSRAALVGAAAFSAAACAQQPRVAAVSQTSSFSYTAADRECMARAMYFESNRSSLDGMLAVGTIVANRVQSGRYGKTVCDVVATRGQFAPGVMTRSMTGASADMARAAADQVLTGKRHPGVKSALHFHTAGMRFRYPNMHYVLVAGGNAFYEKRDSSGGGRAANARSLALALAVARADPTKPHEIQVAAATPLETPLAPAVSTTVAVTSKPGAAPATVMTTQVASVQPTAAPKATMFSSTRTPRTQPVVVAAAAPVAQPQAQTAQAADRAQVAVAQPANRPAAVQTFQVATAKAPAARAAVARPSSQPVAYASADEPAIALPKVRPAPKRTISSGAEPVLASVAPSKPAHKKADAPKPAEAASVEAAPVSAPAAQSPASPVVANHVASAFAAFD